MNDKWTGDLIGKMHNHKISHAELANELNVSPAYLSMVLNGKKKSKGAKEKFNLALNSIIAKRKEGM